jgi:hypothetical protein
MGFWRFRRRIGTSRFWLNFSKGGISTSIGVPGATINTNRGLTVSARGTGLSYTTGWPRGQRGGQPSIATSVVAAVIVFAITWFAFGPAQGWTLL